MEDNSICYNDRAALRTLPRGDRLKAATTRGEARTILARLFAESGVEAPEREARLVICAAAGLRGVDLVADPAIVLGEAAERVEAFAERRAAGEPLSRIVEKREFWSLPFALSPDVLDPRPDTETLVEAALDEFYARQQEALGIVDFGVGSGAILAALLSEFPAATGLGIDRSAAAVDVANGNFARLNLAHRATARAGNWGEGLERPFDLIVANPPYVRSSDIDDLAREVRDHDPKLALDGGDDGLDAYRALMPHIKRLIAPGSGRFFLEHGEGQAQAVRSIAEAAGLEVTIARKDSSGVARIVGGWAR